MFLTEKPVQVTSTFSHRWSTHTIRCLNAYPSPYRKLDDASRSVFKENVRLNEALNYHIKEVEDLKKLAASLAEENASMSMDKVYVWSLEGRKKSHVMVTLYVMGRPPRTETVYIQFNYRWSWVMEDIFLVLFPPVMFTRADCVYFACGPPFPSPPLTSSPACQPSQWLVVMVSFHWHSDSNLVAIPPPPPPSLFSGSDSQKANKYWPP